MLYQQIHLTDFHLYVVRDQIGVVYIGQQNGTLDEILNKFPQASLVNNDFIFKQVESQLKKYLLHETNQLDFPIHLIGTSFQKQVWAGLTSIDYGQTVTYQQIAKTLGIKNKVRAVANAIGQNKLLIIIPCHRVIGSDRKLHGYRWGIKLKEQLLRLEKEPINNEHDN